MRHVNMRNDQTFHFHVFLTSTPACVDELLTRAFDAAAEDDSVDHDGPTSVLQQHLALALEKHLEDLALDAGFGQRPEKSGVYIGDACDGGTASLFLPILWNALGDVCCYAVAEAILRERGKFSPEKMLAEIDEDGSDGGGGSKVPA